MSGIFTLSAQIPVTLFKREIHNKAVLTPCQIENSPSKCNRSFSFTSQNPRSF